jgi:hypothetical protein
MTVHVSSANTSIRAGWPEMDTTGRDPQTSTGTSSTPIGTSADIARVCDAKVSADWTIDRVAESCVDRSSAFTGCLLVADMAVTRRRRSPDWSASTKYDLEILFPTKKIDL